MTKKKDPTIKAIRLSSLGQQLSYLTIVYYVMLKVVRIYIDANYFEAEGL